MSLLRLVLKQMRQRALGTWLTTLMIMLAVALAMAVLLIRREGHALLTQSDFGYDLVVGAKGSQTQLVLSAVLLHEAPQGLIPYRVVEELTGPANRRFVRVAIPLAVADSYRGHRVLATTPRLFNADDEGQALPEDFIRFEIRRGRPLEMAQGRPFHARRFEAVIGAGVAERQQLALGQSIQVTHGPEHAGHAHGESWTVVGILKRSGIAAFDDAVYMPLISSLAIPDHSSAALRHGALRGVAAPPRDAGFAAGQAWRLDGEGNIELALPRELWFVSAVLVRTRGDPPMWARHVQFNLTADDQAMGALPAEIMQQLYRDFLGPASAVLLALSWLVLLVASCAVMVSIYNSVAARTDEIAVFRALGATRRRILAMICLEGLMIGVAGSVLGVVVGHGAAWLLAGPVAEATGGRLNVLWIDGWQLLYLLVVIVLTLGASLAPALKAYRVSVAQNLES